MWIFVGDFLNAFMEGIACQKVRELISLCRASRSMLMQQTNSHELKIKLAVIGRHAITAKQTFDNLRVPAKPTANIFNNSILNAISLKV